MKKIDFLVGIIIGIVATVVGSFIFIKAFTGYEFMNGLRTMHEQGVLGKVVTLGAILNVVLFFVLLKFNKEMMARGIILATIIMTVVTLFL